MGLIEGRPLRRRLVSSLWTTKVSVRVFRRPRIEQQILSVRLVSTANGPVTLGLGPWTV